MGTRKIVTLGDDTLRKHCKPQEKFDRRLETLLKDMADTMYKAEGVGLAGPRSEFCGAWLSSTLRRTTAGFWS